MVGVKEPTEESSPLTTRRARFRFGSGFVSLLLVSLAFAAKVSPRCGIETCLACEYQLRGAHEKENTPALLKRGTRETRNPTVVPLKAA